MFFIRKKLLLAILLWGMSSQGLHAQEPRIERIDPPNWWTGMEHDTVQLLLYGEGLSGVNIKVLPEGPRVLRTHPGATHRHLFVDLHIGPECAPADYRLVVQTLRTETSFSFPILERADRSGRHQGFSADDVVYLIMPDRFADGDRSNNQPDEAKLFLEYDRARPGAWHGGDLQGIIDHLDYLADLGITTIWLTPVLENAGRGSYHGYAATDYYRIDPRFGSNELYAEFVEAAHSLGLKVIFDHVNNHCGVAHEWVLNPPTASWFNGSLEEHDTDAHNLQAVHDPYAAPGALEKLYTFWFVDGMPDLNQRDRHVERYLIQQTLWWIEFSGLDGIREDTYPYADPDYSVRWVNAVLREYPTLNITGESWGPTAYTALFQKDSKVPRSFDANLPSVIDFGFMMAMERYLKGQETLMAIYQRLSEDYLFAQPDQLLSLLGNHDTPRPIFLAGGDAARYKVALHILLTTRGIPQLLYGEEIGIIGGESHVDLRQDFPGGFPGDERSAFMAEGRSGSEQELFSFMRELLSLRQDYPALRRGELRHVRPDWDGGYYAYARFHESGDVLSVVNGSDKEQYVSFKFLQALLGSADEAAPAKAASLRDLRSGEQLSLAPGQVIPMEAFGTRLYLIER